MDSEALMVPDDFERSLPLVLSVGKRVMHPRINPLDLVYAGAIALYRLTSQYPEGCGIPFVEWAEGALLGELSAFAQSPFELKLPDALLPYAPQLLALARELSVPELRIVPYSPNLPALVDEFAVPAWQGTEKPFEPFIRALKQYWVLVLLLVLLCESAVAFMSLKEKKVYQAIATVNTGIATGNNLSGTQTDWFRAGTLMGNLTELMKSRTVLEATIKTLGLKTDPEKLAKKIAIDRVGTTDLLRISAVGDSPQAAADLANTQVNEFARYYASVQSQDARSADSFIRKQVADAEGRLRTAEGRLKQFKSAYVPESEAKIAGRLADLDLEEEELQQSIAAARAGLAASIQELNSLKADPSLVRQVSGAAAVTAAEERLRTLRQNLDDAVRVGDQAIARELRSQINQARGRIHEATSQAAAVNPAIADAVARKIAFKVELAQNTAKLEALRASRGRLGPQAKQASQNEITFKQLQREVALAEAEYQRLTERSGQTNLALHGATQLSLSVVDPAVPPGRPMSRKIPLKLAAGLILSLLMGSMLAYLLSRIRPATVESV